MFKKKKTNKLIKFKRNVKKPLTHHICCHKYESSNSWSSKFLNFHWTMRDTSFETIDSSWTKLSKRYYTQWPEYWLMDARDASPPPLICFRKYRHCVFANQPTLPLLLAEQWADFVPPGHCELNFARTRFIVSRIVEISTPRMEHAAFRNNWFHYRRFHSSRSDLRYSYYGTTFYFNRHGDLNLKTGERKGRSLYTVPRSVTFE